MASIRRRSPISSRVDVTTPSGLGQGIEQIGKAVSVLQSQRKKRKAEKQESEAIEDYLRYKKEYTQYAVTDFSESVQAEDVDGHSDRVFGFGKDLVGRGLADRGRKDKSPYGKKLSALIQNDIEGFTSKAIRDEEGARLKINANKWDRAFSKIIDGASTSTLVAELTGIGTDVGSLMESIGETYSIQGEKVKELQKDRLTAEVKDRVRNANLSNEQEIRDFMESDISKEIYGNDHAKENKHFEQSMDWYKDRNQRVLIQDNMDQVSKYTNMLDSLSSSNVFKTPADVKRIEKITGGKPMSSTDIINKGYNSILKEIDENVLLGDIDVDSADAIKERLSRQKDKIITGELAPSVDSVKSSMIDISARLSGSKSLVEDAGDDEDDLSVAFDDYISNYKDMVDLLEYSSKLPMKAEDRDNMRKAISNAEVEISTYLNNTEESYFLKSNIDPGDSDRIGVQAENFYKQMEYGAYAGLPPVQKAQLRKHVINGVIAEQSNRNARREQGEKVPPLDVMGNTEEAQAFVSNLIQGGLRDIMGEEAYDNQKKAQDDAISFISNAQSEYDRDDTAGKDLFRASALAHGISPDGVDAMISDIQDKESKEQALSPTEITIDLSKENPFEKARELEDMNTPESLALAKKIRDEVGSSQIEQLKKIDQEAYRQLYDFVTLYGYGSKIESAIADKVKGIYRVLTEGAGEEFEVDPTGGAEEVFTQKEGVLNLRVDDADIDNSMNEPLNSGVIVKDGMSAGGISVKDPDLKSSASLIQREEGENKVSGRHVSYKDDSFEEGVVSGGRGHRLTEAEKKKYPVGTPIPDNVVDEWFREDVKKARRASVRAISGFNELPSPVKDAITSLAFQIGEGKAGGKKGLKGFSKTIKILEERPFTKDSAIRASEEILDSRWAKEQTPKRAKRASEMIRNSI